MNLRLPSIALPFFAVLPALAMAVGCNRTVAAAWDRDDSEASAPGVRVEVLSTKKLSGEEGKVLVRFRATNDSDDVVIYQGFSEEIPSLNVDVIENGAWAPYSVGYFGTGVLDMSIQPGSSFAFALNLPADGRTYRASFGDPRVITPPVVAKLP
jgi:hypothetical protein